MNVRGGTSKEVSETSLPKAKQLKTRASCSSGRGPTSRRLIRSSVFNSWSGASDGAVRFGRRSRATSVSFCSNSRSVRKNASMSARVSGLASPATYNGHRSAMTSRSRFPCILLLCL
jgi:hypothetical protein